MQGDLKERVRQRSDARSASCTTRWSACTGLSADDPGAQRAAWGARVVTRLAEDLRTEFPETSGWNRRNLLYTRAFAAAWLSNVPQPVAQFPWGHVRVLLDRLDDADEREWYAVESTTNGWTRAVLDQHASNKCRGGRLSGRPVHRRGGSRARGSGRAQSDSVWERNGSGTTSCDRDDALPRGNSGPAIR